MPTEKSAIPNVIEAVDRFRRWADAHYPGRSTDYWVFEYDGWDELHAAVTQFVEDVPIGRWTNEQTRAVLDAIHYNDEHLYLAREIARRRPDLLIPLANASMSVGSGYAVRWQLAEQISLMPDSTADREQVLLKFASDEDEYVRRQALKALARIGSSAAEGLALKAWSDETDAQQWSRMMALWVLRHVGSTHFARLLADAERDSREHLASYAVKLRDGDVEP